MLDFNKLMDPEWQAQARAERDAEAARQEELRQRQNAAIEVCMEAFDTLTPNQKGLVRSARMAPFLTKAQSDWLFIIESQVKKRNNKA